MAILMLRVIGLMINARNVIILSKSYPSDLSFRIIDAQVSIVDHLDIKGVIIDNSLNFSKHIAKITMKVGKQLDVLSKLKNMLSTSKMCL